MQTRILLVFRVINILSHRWSINTTILLSNKTKVKLTTQNITNPLISIRMLFFLIKFKRDLSLRIKLIKPRTIKLKKFSRIKVKNRCKPTINQLRHKILLSYISIPTHLRWEINPKILKEVKESYNTTNKNKFSKFKKFKSKFNSNNNK